MAKPQGEVQRDPPHKNFEDVGTLRYILVHSWHLNVIFLVRTLTVQSTCTEKSDIIILEYQQNEWEKCSFSKVGRVHITATQFVYFFHLFRCQLM